MTFLVDERMSFFLKKNFYSKNFSNRKTTLIENTENINFQEISRKYGINLKTIFQIWQDFRQAIELFSKKKVKIFMKSYLLFFYNIQYLFFMKKKNFTHNFMLHYIKETTTQ